VNAPFGSSTHPQNRNWDGLFSSTGVHLATYDLNPSIAYRILPGLSVGVGAQIQYMSADLRNAVPRSPVPFPFANSPTVILDGQDHWAFGWTAGVHWQPTQSTQIGFGYRSAVNELLQGEVRVSDPTLTAATTALTEASINLPAIATASFRQDLTPTFALLGTAQWTQWSNLQSLDVKCRSASALCTGGAGSTLESIPFHWHDGWLFSAGVEQKLSEALLLRAGAAYEKSPVRSPDENKVSILDSDRIWASAGVEYKINRMMTADLSYAHVFFKDSFVNDTQITAPAPIGALTTIGSTQRSADIFSVSLKMRLDPPPAPAPKIVK
jgi:long-chain fatty acid transport protein